MTLRMLPWLANHPVLDQKGRVGVAAASVAGPLGMTGLVELSWVYSSLATVAQQARAWRAMVRRGFRVVQRLGRVGLDLAWDKQKWVVVLVWVKVRKVMDLAWVKLKRVDLAWVKVRRVAVVAQVRAGLVRVRSGLQVVPRPGRPDPDLAWDMTKRVGVRALVKLKRVDLALVKVKRVAVKARKRAVPKAGRADLDLPRKVAVLAWVRLKRVAVVVQVEAKAVMEVVLVKLGQGVMPMPGAVASRCPLLWVVEKLEISPEVVRRKTLQT